MWMRRIVLAAFIAAVAVGVAAREIESDALLEHIRFLASDGMKGRGNGTEELERAAEYIAQQFKAVGLRPGGKSESYFQPFDLNAGLIVGRDNTLSIDYRGKSV